jgi:putative membrane protein
MSPATLDAIFALAHFLAIFMLVGALMGEAYLLRLPLGAEVIGVLARVDRSYGIAAGLVILAGLGRVFFGAIDEGFYFASHAFWGKMACFAAAGIISIFPTVKILAWRKASKADGAFAPPAAEIAGVRPLVMAQVGLVGFIALFAVLMTRTTG